MTTSISNQLRYTKVGPSQVSTIRTHPAAPCPFETAVLDGPLSGRSEYHDSENEAWDGHQRWVDKVREVEDGITDYARSVRSAASKRAAVQAVRDAYRAFELWEDAKTRDALIAALSIVPD